MASVEELLLNTLQDLGSDELKGFQWFLRNHKQMPTSELENANRFVTVDKMVDRFGKEGAMKILLEILRKMNKNNLAKQLENKHGSIYQIIQNPEYEFLQYFRQFTLDSNTVHPHFHLSEGNTVITHTGTNYRYPVHPDRFDHHAQALCQESVSGRCYWEVEYSGREGVHIVVAYKSIGRKGMGNDSRFGYNSQSWRLYCSNSKCSFRHNTVRTELPVVSSRRIGVYVDHSAGILSFYSVSDTMSLIHRVQTTFTQPFYPGFGAQNDTTLKLCRQHCN